MHQPDSYIHKSKKIQEINNFTNGNSKKQEAFTSIPNKSLITTNADIHSKKKAENK